MDCSEFAVIRKKLPRFTIAGPEPAEKPPLELQLVDDQEYECVTLRVKGVEQGNLLTFSSNGVSRHFGVNPSLGLPLDGDGRLIIE